MDRKSIKKIRNVEEYIPDKSLHGLEVIAPFRQKTFYKSNIYRYNSKKNR